MYKWSYQHEYLTVSQYVIWCCVGHSHWVLYVAWSPDGKKLASGCKNGDVRSSNLSVNEQLGHPTYVG